MIRATRVWLGAAIETSWLRVAPRRALERAASTASPIPTARLGRIGEELACRELSRMGWRILARNLRAPEGELDVVALDGRVTVVVEVKTGRRPRGGWVPGRLPRDRVLPVAVSRRARAAGRLARAHRASPGSSRVDLIEVRVGQRGARAQLHHLRDLGALGLTWRRD